MRVVFLPLKVCLVCEGKFASEGLQNLHYHHNTIATGVVKKFVTLHVYEWKCTLKVAAFASALVHSFVSIQSYDSLAYILVMWSIWQDDILLEVQIQNTTPQPMFLEVMNFDPAAGFTAVDLNRVESREEEKWVVVP